MNRQIVLLVVPLALIELVLAVVALVDWARRRAFRGLPRWGWLAVILFVAGKHLRVRRRQSTVAVMSVALGAMILVVTMARASTLRYSSSSSFFFHSLRNTSCTISSASSVCSSIRLATLKILSLRGYTLVLKSVRFILRYRRFPNKIIT